MRNRLLTGFTVDAIGCKVRAWTGEATAIPNWRWLAHRSFELSAYQPKNPLWDEAYVRYLKL